MHLEGGKGTYFKKEDILEEILSQLWLILVHLKRQGEGRKQIVGTAMVVLGRLFCNLHDMAGNADCQ